MVAFEVCQPLRLLAERHHHQPPGGTRLDAAPRMVSPALTLLSGRFAAAAGTRRPAPEPIPCAITDQLASRGS
jgi:hypothetical protein